MPYNDALPFFELAFEVLILEDIDNIHAISSFFSN
jgi:hypothetical protein